MPIREIRSGRPVARRRVVREIRRVVPGPDDDRADLDPATGASGSRGPSTKASRLVVLDPVPDITGGAEPSESSDPLGETDVSTGDSGGRQSRRRLRTSVRSHLPRRTVALAVVLCAAVLVTLSITGVRWYHQQRLESARQGALAAARQTTVDFVSISAATVDRDLQRIAAATTGDFKDEFTRGLPQVRTAVVENKVSSTGSVLRAALVSSDLDSAVALVAIDASVKNTGAPDGRISHYRIQVDLSLDPGSGRWLVSRLQFVG
jgi:Mce-associated membrane protein